MKDLIVNLGEGTAAIHGIRDGAQLRTLALLGCDFMLTANRLTLETLRPDEDIKTWYIREIRIPFRQLIAL
jgi:hypothetical protein